MVYSALGSNFAGNWTRRIFLICGGSALSSPVVACLLRFRIVVSTQRDHTHYRIAEQRIVL